MKVPKGHNTSKRAPKLNMNSAFASGPIKGIHTHKAKGGPGFEGGRGGSGGGGKQRRDRKGRFA